VVLGGGGLVVCGAAMCPGVVSGNNFSRPPFWLSDVDQNLDQGSKKCSIFKVLGMRRKWCHCVRLVLLIPAVYLLSQTESVWRSYRGLFAEPNRQNFDADWAGRTADVAGRTADVAAVQ
jgi:hypothetical protein